MQLSQEQINKLIELQKEQGAVKQIIDYLSGLIEQMAGNPCTLTISFNMHNEDQHAKNEAEMYSYSKEEESPFWGFGFDGLRGFINQNKKVNQAPCRYQLQFQVTESTGIRILNAVIQEKQELYNHLKHQIEIMLIHTMKIELIETTANPVQELNK